MAVRYRCFGLPRILPVSWCHSLPHLRNWLDVLRRLLLQFHHDDDDWLRWFGAWRLPDVVVHVVHSHWAGTHEYHHRASQTTIRSELAEAAATQAWVICWFAETAWSSRGHRCQRPAIDSLSRKFSIPFHASENFANEVESASRIHKQFKFKRKSHSKMLFECESQTEYFISTGFNAKTWQER